MKLDRTLRRLGVASAMAALLLGAAPVALMAETPADTLVIAGTIDDIVSLDPAEAYEFSGLDINNNTYDGLVELDPTNGQMVPGLAESWSVADDGTTYTFKMRPGVTFASGNPLRAEDAAWSLQRVIKLNKTPAFILGQFGWTPENVDQMVTAPDDSTLVVKIGVDFAPSLVNALLSSVVGSVVDMKTAMEHEKNGDFGYEWLKTNTAGSGAFTLKGWKPNESVVLEANPSYRGGEPAMKRVVIRHVPEPAAQRLLIEKGDTDVALNLTGPYRLTVALRTALRASTAAGGASVVNLASMSALRSVPMVPGYGAAKSGIINVTRNLAVKWAKYGIRVNAVAPGTIDTPMTQPMHAAPELVASEIGHIPAGRMGGVDEVAPTIAFLCTSQSAYTSGAVFVVDGASDCV